MGGRTVLSDLWLECYPSILLHLLGQLLNHLLLLLLIRSRVALEPRVIHVAGELLRVERIENIEKESAMDLSSLGHSIREVEHEVLIILQDFHEPVHTEFLVHGNRNSADILVFQHALFFFEDCAQEVLVDV